jgi:hypothetical protein
MRKIVGYLWDYIKSIDKRVFGFSVLFTTALVFCNYYFHLNRRINHLEIYWQYLYWFLLFCFVLGFGYCVQPDGHIKKRFGWRKLSLLIVIAAAIFSWKMAYRFRLNFSPDPVFNEYWNAVVYWPLKVLAITVSLAIVHRLFDKEQDFYGVRLRSLTIRPYLIMLLIMVPLIALASTQKDFLQMYPRMQKIALLQQPETGWYQLLYQLSYGVDFFAIELFFRGFLVLAFARVAGKGAILPMAIFYCTIHFGKPLGECISSFFGGIILGVVSYHTRTILGGFMVHVGIAWLMELAGSFPLFT